jgi:hypothetical protein
MFLIRLRIVDTVALSEGEAFHILTLTKLPFFWPVVLFMVAMLSL